MSRKNLYITQSGTLKRKDNTLLFKNKETKKTIPISGLETVYAFGELSINSKLLDFFSQNNILFHHFNYYDYYSGTYYPREQHVSGKLLVKQVEYYKNEQKRLRIAKKFVFGLGKNLHQVLKHYYKHGKNLKIKLDHIDRLIGEIDEQDDVQQLLNIEGKLWSAFYGSFDKFLPDEFVIENREKQPPPNPINAMISFGNSMLYTQVLSQIYQTQLNPTISYLHEPSTKRFSLSLDIAEIFKPKIVFRTIFKLINLGSITPAHFEDNVNKCLLNEKGRKKFIQEFDSRLDKTFKHESLNRKVSNKYCFKLECYKLIKHVLEDQEYKPYLISKKK